MKNNESKTDRIVRLVMAIIFFVIAYYLSGLWSVIFYILAALMLITSAAGSCLLYSLIGVNTCKVKSVSPVMDKKSDNGSGQNQGQS